MLEEMFSRLKAAFGPQNWWPAESAEEMIIGAVLTQNTNWLNVEKALAGLRERQWLTLSALAQAPTAEIEKTIRPAGYFRQKSRRLKGLARVFLKAGGLDDLQQRPTAALREWLLAINGIGPETADSILLYAFNRPVFVIDAYTLRICRRHGWLSEKDGYAAAQAWFSAGLPSDAQLFNDFHALLVLIGKDYCRARKAECDDCPLSYHQPPAGGS